MTVRSKVLEYLKDHSNGARPKEIASAYQLRSTRGLHRTLNILCLEGKIERVEITRNKVIYSLKTEVVQ